MEREPHEQHLEPEALQRGHSMVERIRAEANHPLSYWSEAGEGEDVFRTLYLTSRDSAVPEHLVSGGLNLDYDIHTDITMLYRQVLAGVRDELDATGLVPGDAQVSIAVEPSIDDHTVALMFVQGTLLLTHWSKARTFHWPDEDSMAKMLGHWYDTAAVRLRGELPARPTAMSPGGPETDDTVGQEPSSHQPESRPLSTGQHVLERIRSGANDGDGYFGSGAPDEDVFGRLYLTPRDTAIPKEFVSDDWQHELSMDIRALHGQVFEGIRAELRERMGREESLWVIVDPAIDDQTFSLLCTDRTVLLIDATKPWHLWWDSENAMANDLEGWYESAATRLLAERQSRPSTYGAKTGV